MNRVAGDSISISCTLNNVKAGSVCRENREASNELTSQKEMIPWTGEEFVVTCFCFLERAMGKRKNLKD